MVRLVSDIMPQGLAEAVDTLLLIDELCRRGWVDADAGAAVPAAPRRGSRRCDRPPGGSAARRRAGRLLPTARGADSGSDRRGGRCSELPGSRLPSQRRVKASNRPQVRPAPFSRGPERTGPRMGPPPRAGVQHRGGGPDRRKRPDRRPQARRARCRRAACAVSAQRHRPRLPLPASARLGDVRVGRSGKSGLRGTVPQSIAAETLARAGLELVDGLDSRSALVLAEHLSLPPPWATAPGARTACRSCPCWGSMQFRRERPQAMGRPRPPQHELEAQGRPRQLPQPWCVAWRLLVGL